MTFETTLDSIEKLANFILLHISLTRLVAFTCRIFICIFLEENETKNTFLVLLVKFALITDYV